MTATNRHEVTVERHGRQIAIRAEFLNELVREAITDAWAPSRRVAFEEFGYADAQLRKSVEADACISGPAAFCDETERLAGEAEERWADLDLSSVAFLPLPAAKALFEALGVALLAEAGADVRRIPAARSAA